jgi:hypothetical protein
MGTLVRDNLVPVQTVTNESLEPKIAQDNSPVLLSCTPAWIAELAGRWRKHHASDLELKFTTGVTINSKIGLPSVRQPRGHEVVVTLTIELGVDCAEISRMRHFATLAGSYE